MQLDNLLGLAVIMGLFGLLILVPLWPGERQGRRVLHRWGVTGPSEEDVRVAVTYLKRRRFWYPWLFLGLPVAASALNVPEPQGAQLWTVLATLLFGALIAELLAQRPVKQARREALLVHRGLFDLVPAWAFALGAVVFAVAGVRLALAGRWPLIVLGVTGVAVAGLVLMLTIRRPATGDVAVDLALRTRSARVATGLGIAVPTTLTGPETGPGWWVMFLTVVVAVAGFVALTRPMKAAV